MSFPLDISGRAPSNKIMGETHTLTLPNWRSYHVIIPKNGPFFEEGLALRYRNSQGILTPLTKGVDWMPSYWFISASRETQRGIYGSITFINSNLAGTVEIDYQTLGGDWVVDYTVIQQKLAEKLYNPMATSYEVIANLPTVFPPQSHDHSITNDFTDMGDLVSAINTLTDTYRTWMQNGSGSGTGTGTGGTTTNVTKATIGLDKVLNLGILPANRYTTDQTDGYYTTPKAVHAMINHYALTPLDALMQRRDNPFAVTASQVNAYTKTETDDLLREKLGTTGTALDTTRFAGRSWSEAQAEFLTGTINNAQRLDGRTYTQLVNDVGAQIASTQTFGGRTAEQYKTYVLSGTAENSNKFNERTDTEFVTWLGTQTLNATTLANTTLEEIYSQIDNRKAADSSRLDGKTLQEVKTEFFDTYLPYGLDIPGLTQTIKGNLEAAGGITINTTQIETNVKAALDGQVNAGRLEGKNLTEIRDEVLLNHLPYYVPKRGIPSVILGSDEKAYYHLLDLTYSRLTDSTKLELLIEGFESTIAKTSITAQVLIDTRMIRNNSFGEALSISIDHKGIGTDEAFLLEELKGLISLRYVSNSTSFKLYLVVNKSHEQLNVVYGNMPYAAVGIPRTITKSTTVMETNTQLLTATYPTITVGSGDAGNTGTQPSAPTTTTPSLNGTVFKVDGTDAEHKIPASGTFTLTLNADGSVKEIKSDDSSENARMSLEVALAGYTPEDNNTANFGIVTGMFTLHRQSNFNMAWPANSNYGKGVDEEPDMNGFIGRYVFRYTGLVNNGTPTVFDYIKFELIAEIAEH